MDLDLVLAGAPLDQLVHLAQAVESDQEGFFFEVFGQRIRLLFFKQENGVKLLLTAAVLLLLLAVRWVAQRVVRLLQRGTANENLRFLDAAGSEPRVRRVAAARPCCRSGSMTRPGSRPGIGLVTAGLAFALQKVITAVAGYFVILRGDTFSVGDRITMGGVRGDVIELGFIKTTIMEMGQPPAVQNADPASG